MIEPKGLPGGDTICIGETLAEWIFHYDEGLPENQTVIAEDAKKVLGGAALNVYWYFMQLDHASRLVAPVECADQEMAEAIFADNRVGATDFIPIPGGTDTLFTVVDKESHRSVYAMSSWAPGTRDLVLESCSEAKNLILNGGRHEELRICYREFAVANAASFVAFNPSYAIFAYSADELATIVERAQVTVVNAQEFDFLESCIGELKPERLRTDIAQVVAVTRGADGVSVLSGDGTFELPSLTFSDRIALGAGDAFFAGFLHRLLNGASPLESTRYGLGLAAIVVDSNQVRVAVSEEEVRQQLG